MRLNQVRDSVCLRTCQVKRQSSNLHFEILAYPDFNDVHFSSCLAYATDNQQMQLLSHFLQQQIHLYW